jgi:hypothetical protein
MRLTTPEAPIDLLAVLPELADLRATTIRLHPRKGRVPGRYASKMGGTFLWPSEEPWPTCDEAWPPAMVDGVPIPEGDPRAAPFPLVPVLQLRADDFPEMPFPPWADLFQLLWCPLGHNYAFMPKPFVFWRNSGEVRRPRNPSRGSGSLPAAPRCRCRSDLGRSTSSACGHRHRPSA